jgi:hypothetical protein
MARKSKSVKPSNLPKKILLKNPTFKMEGDRIVAITGTCLYPNCKETRTIYCADAFQVRYCKPHQLEAVRENRRVKAQGRRAAKAK